MKDKIARLHQLRQDSVRVDAEIAEYRATWEQNMADLFTEKEMLGVGITDLEADIKAERVADYDGEDKSKVFGVGIRVKSGITFNSEKAFAWAKEHNLALQLDKARFVALADPLDMDFVSSTTEVTATIATDLSEYLD